MNQQKKGLAGLIAASPSTKTEREELGLSVHVGFLRSFHRALKDLAGVAHCALSDRRRRMKNADTMESLRYCFCTPAVGLRAELEKKVVVDHTSVEVVPTADAHRTAIPIVHTLTVDVPFDQISLFELQRRRVMTRQGALVKRTKKKNETWRTKGGSFEPSNLCELRAWHSKSTRKHCTQSMKNC